MRKEPLVSVIIPAYNAKKFLPQAVESALNQTYRNIEVIVVDDGSTDGTEDLPILKDQRVHYFKIPHSGGPATPRNVGIQHVKGELVAFCDADDIWLPEKLEKQVRFLQEGNFDFVSCDAKVINEEGEIIRSSYLGETKPLSDNAFAELYQNNFIITSSVLVKKKCLDEVGLMEKNLEGVEDYDLWLRTAASGARFGFLPESLLLYRNRLSGHRYKILSRMNDGRELRAITRNFGLAKKLLGAKSELRPFSLSRAAAFYFKRKNFLEYLRFKLLCLRYFPWGTGGWEKLWPEAKSVIKL